MSKLELLDQNTLQDVVSRPGMHLFGYQLNRIGYTLVLGVGALMLAGAGVLWWKTGLAAHVWTAAFTGLIAGGGALAVYAGYWYAFASTRFLGVSADKLLIGRRNKAWMVDWSVLDAQALGFDDLDATTRKGSLDVEVGGQHLQLHLYNAYVFLGDLQGFMFQVLDHLRPGEQTDRQTAEQPDEAATAVDAP